ncbi:MAG: hypothetical protein GY744_01480 [Gammaproteobacteria bacterium]|nr:hypothetical protein [Gammaproteobacteria bacterium]
MSKAHVGFQVRQHNPWRAWLVIGLVILLLFVMFLSGRAYQSFELKQLKLEKEVMANRIVEAEQRISLLVKSNAQLKGTSKIEHDAYEKANRSQVRLQKELLEMKEQLVFYQGIVSPEQLSLGVNIQSFVLNKKNNLGMYYYKLVLSKRGKSNKFVKGSFDLLIKGQQEGQSKDLVFKQIKQEYSGKDIKFSFRYFQVFEGDLLLPDLFEPYEIQIKIKPTTKKIKPFSESISWTQALSGGNN